jgi:hypothetical protein
MLKYRLSFLTVTLLLNISETSFAVNTSTDEFSPNKLAAKFKGKSSESSDLKSVPVALLQDPDETAEESVQVAPLDWKLLNNKKGLRSVKGVPFSLLNEFHAFRIAFAKELIKPDHKEAVSFINALDEDTLEHLWTTSFKMKRKFKLNRWPAEKDEHHQKRTESEFLRAVNLLARLGKGCDAVLTFIDTCDRVDAELSSFLSNTPEEYRDAETFNSALRAAHTLMRNSDKSTDYLVSVLQVINWGKHRERTAHALRGILPSNVQVTTCLGDLSKSVMKWNADPEITQELVSCLQTLNFRPHRTWIAYPSELDYLWNLGPDRKAIVEAAALANPTEFIEYGLKGYLDCVQKLGGDNVVASSRAKEFLGLPWHLDLDSYYFGFLESYVNLGSERDACLDLAKDLLSLSRFYNNSKGKILLEIVSAIKDLGEERQEIVQAAKELLNSEQYIGIDAMKEALQLIKRMGPRRLEICKSAKASMTYGIVTDKARLRGVLEKFIQVD